MDRRHPLLPGNDISRRIPAADPVLLELRNDGIRNVFLGIGLAIFLGLIIGKLGLAIGALIGCIGLGKIITWALSRKDDPNKREKE